MIKCGIINYGCGDRWSLLSAGCLLFLFAPVNYSLSSVSFVRACVLCVCAYVHVRTHLFLFIFKDSTPRCFTSISVTIPGRRQAGLSRVDVTLIMVTKQFCHLKTFNLSCVKHKVEFGNRDGFAGRGPNEEATSDKNKKTSKARVKAQICRDLNLTATRSSKRSRLLHGCNLTVCAVFTMVHVWTCCITSASSTNFILLSSPTWIHHLHKCFSTVMCHFLNLLAFIYTLWLWNAQSLSFPSRVPYLTGTLLCCQNIISAVTSLPGCRKVSNTTKQMCPLVK